MNGWATLGSVFGMLAVALGAFGAHALREQATPDRLAVFQTGVQYQAIHALALLIVAVWMRVAGESRGLNAAGWCFTIGVFLFSGSLYALVVLDMPRLGMITPIGGVAFIAGWASLVWASVTSSKRDV
ncbi:MAG: DUF423 domain-containing protein [Methanoregulaceae archaeon]|nr:DUF423 domain-containing protein [Methanoregulaceae archaeon]